MNSAGAPKDLTSSGKVNLPCGKVLPLAKRLCALCATHLRWGPKVAKGKRSKGGKRKNS